MSVPLALAALLLAVPTSIAEPSASPQEEDCVTRAEYRQARHDMTKRQVHRIFGTGGRLVYLVVGNEEKREYPMCNPSVRLEVTYFDGRLAYKQLRD